MLYITPSGEHGDRPVLRQVLGRSVKTGKEHYCDAEKYDAAYRARSTLLTHCVVLQFEVESTSRRLAGPGVSDATCCVDHFAGAQSDRTDAVCDQCVRRGAMQMHRSLKRHRRGPSLG